MTTRARRDNYVKPFTYRPLRMMLGGGLLTAEEGPSAVTEPCRCGLR